MACARLPHLFMVWVFGWLVLREAMTRADPSLARFGLDQLVEDCPTRTTAPRTPPCVLVALTAAIEKTSLSQER